MANTKHSSGDHDESTALVLIAVLEIPCAACALQRSCSASLPPDTMGLLHLLLPQAVFLSSPAIFINRHHEPSSDHFSNIQKRESHFYSGAIFPLPSTQYRHDNSFNYQKSASEAQQTWEKNCFIF